MDRAQLTISPDSPVAFVDIETTGGSPGLHRIIDVAVIGCTGDTVDFEWQSLVNPGVRVPAGITALTGIDNAMIEEAPPFERIARELRERLEGRVFVAHNVRFDYGFSEGAYTNGGNTDGAVFRVERERPGQPAAVLFERLLQPQLQAADRGTLQADIDLAGSVRGDRLVVRIEPGPANNGAWDWTYLDHVRFTGP